MILLILLVSILFSISNNFVCCFRLLKFCTGKKQIELVCVSDSIQQESLAISFEVGRIYFSLDLSTKQFIFDTSANIKYTIYKKLPNANF